MQTKTTRAQVIQDRVEDWIRGSDPERIEKRVRDWVGRSSTNSNARKSRKSRKAASIREKSSSHLD